MFLLKSAAPIFRSSVVRQFRTASSAISQPPSSDSQKHEPPTSADFTLQILAAANSGSTPTALQNASKMRNSQVAPSISVYNALMGLAARERHWLFSWAIFDDMVRSDIKPTEATYAHLIQAQQSRNYTNTWLALSELNRSGLTPNSAIATAILDSLVAQGNLETALHYLLNMKAQSITPELATVQTIIVLAASCGYSRLSIELATFFEKDTLRKLDESVWLTCLASSAQNYHVDGVIGCWSKVVDELQMLPDEGTVVAVLHTAARYGLPDLATDALRVLKLTGVTWQELHFAALIEAFCRNEQLKEAFVTLDIMRTNGVEPSETTANSILDYVKRDANTLDTAWAVLDTIHSSGSGVGVDAVKVVIKAAIAIGDLQRAIGIYKALPDYSLSPDISIFDTLLEGCVIAQHRQLGDLLLEDIKQAGLKPDIHTFEQMIRLCLTQDVYEDAFYYLEEMKSAQISPPQSVYEAMAEKCKNAQDSRLGMVLEEMKELGYEAASNLKPRRTKRRKLEDRLDSSRPAGPRDIS
ncbi:hypothetical protein CPB83DRAFT_853083 [Crepidotus variabilis]|uniref:Pentatricopeptide repeat-containing protein-mitochondrial domain-containing protein n=1 Tax=Crepidotus variabilis TaxID=179855 RepID=A0A9P6EGU0_9AGAR|nr:hypothetical protein CPB83DRAFT_853083 [Crepidotus variabilis]